MSQSKPLAKSVAKAKSKPVAARKKPAAAAPAAGKSAAASSEEALSAEVMALAARVEQAIKGSETKAVLEPEAVQAMLAALCRVYSAHSELGAQYDAFSQRNPVTPTDVMVTASGLLKAANLAVFELGMWQSWTGR